MDFPSERPNTNTPALIRSRETGGKDEMPSRHSAAAVDLVKHFPEIRDAANVSSSLEIEHSSQDSNHCTSECVDHCRRIERPTSEDIFLSFLRAVNPVFPFMDVLVAQETFQTFYDVNKLPFATPARAKVLPRILTREAEQRRNSGISDDETPKPLIPAAESIALLIFALGALHWSNLGACKDCCVPGLQCFQQALGTLGLYASYPSLECVNGYILGAIYANMLNDPQKSKACLQKAGRTMSTYFQQSPPPQKPPEQIEKTKEMSNLSYWGWFQLESDLLSEKYFPRSELSGWAERISLHSYEKKLRKLVMMLRLKLRSSPPLEQIMKYHQEQINIRKIQNRIYKNLDEVPMNMLSLRGHHINFRLTNDKPCTEEADQFWERLQEWRTHLGEELRWMASDPLTSESYEAQLRHEYYSACALATRPCLKAVWQAESGNCVTDSIEFEPTELDHGVASGDFPNSVKAAQHLGNLLGINPQIVLNAARCVWATRQSAIVLTGVLDNSTPLKITNIYVTMQTLYCNIRILFSLRQREGCLSWLISDRDLLALLDKTIRFMKARGWETQETRKNIKMLKDIRPSLLP